MITETLEVEIKNYPIQIGLIGFMQGCKIICEVLVNLKENGPKLDVVGGQVDFYCWQGKDEVLLGKHIFTGFRVNMKEIDEAINSRCLELLKVKRENLNFIEKLEKGKI